MDLKVYDIMEEKVVANLFLQFPDIAIHGKMGSGKTYLCHILENEYDYQRMSFAQPLKDIVSALERTNSPLITALGAFMEYPITIRETFKLCRLLRMTLNVPAEHPKPRQRLQFLGASARNEIAKDFWIRLAIDTMQSKREVDPSVAFVFDDARYENELDALKEVGFVLIHLDVPIDVRLKRLRELYGITDEFDSRLCAESEVGADSYTKFDYRLVNVGDEAVVELLRILQQYV